MPILQFTPEPKLKGKGEHTSHERTLCLGQKAIFKVLGEDRSKSSSLMFSERKFFNTISEMSLNQQDIQPPLLSI